MKDGIAQRGRQWYYIVRVTDPETGKRKAQWVSRGPDGRRLRSKAEAKAARDAARDRANRGATVAATKITVREYLEAWQAGLAGQVRQSTALSYRTHVRVHIAPALGQARLQELTAGQVKGFYADLLAKGLAPNTVRRVAATLHRALRDAVDEGYLLHNPADKARPPSAAADAPRDMQVWTPAELRAFLGHVRGERHYALWRLLAMTGMRRGEALGLRWGDIDMAARRVSVSRTLVTVGYEVSEGRPKTARGRRVIDLDEATVDALREQAARQLDDHKACRELWTDTGYVFTREDGQPLHPDFVSRTFEALVAGAALKRIRLHDLRHTHASHLLAAGVPAKVVSERLGHSTVAFTMQVYQHTLPGQGEQAASVAAALVADAADRGA